MIRIELVNTCPHCYGPAMTAKDKLLTGPIASTHCAACGKPVGLSLMGYWPLLFYIIPVHFFGGRHGFVDFLLTVIGISLLVAWVYLLPLERR